MRKPGFYFRYMLVVCVLAGLSACSATGPGQNTTQTAAQAAYAPEQAKAFARQGFEAHQRGDVVSAIESWQAAVALDPTDAVTINNLALLLNQQNRFREAARLLERGLEAMPDMAPLHYNLAVINELYLLNLDKALSHYQQYRELTGENDKLVAGWIADLERRLQ